MAPIIRAVLSTLLSPAEAAEIEIIANDVKYLDPEQKGDKWEIVFRHPESGFGHDKSKAILPYRDLDSKPTLFFCGDGVSGELAVVILPEYSMLMVACSVDLSAAKHADVLFAKEMANGDSDLMSYCRVEKIPYVPFTDL
jgi:2-hydroxy-3-keto-5-methylthiopentenyl-1-phosphate phosphatase